MRKKTIKGIFRNLDAEIPDSLKSQKINQIHYDSRKIQPGGLFVAVKGFITDGHNYLKKIKDAGATAAVVEGFRKDFNIPQIGVKNTRVALGILAKNFYSPEIDELSLVGITGTNGKTTTSYLCRSMLEKSGIATGLIGTIAYHVGSKKVDAWNTTPESVDLCEMLFQMEQADQKACVLEVSSHALALHRVAGLSFNSAVFTNFSRDHLDFHKDEEDYFKAKLKLFSKLKEMGTAVIGIDDPQGKRIIKLIDKNVLSFGFDQQADIRIANWKMDMSGMVLDIITPSGQMVINTKLISKFNIQNILAAIGVGLAENINLNSIQEGIEAVGFIPGRLQSFEIKPDILSVIDYSHTPDSLDKALGTLRQVVKNRLIVVFGCGGDRDKGKRPEMGKIAENQADFVIVTTDNPRTENPAAIINDIVEGMSLKEKRQIVVDRREAIDRAVNMAEEGDIVLVAGKGHESYQEINGIKYDFDEVSIIKEAAAHA